MPHEQAELNMRLFAERVMPVLQRDRGFATTQDGAVSQAAPGVVGPAGIFAPA